MPKIKIPENLTEYFRAEGIDKLTEFLTLHPEITPVFVVSPQNPNYPQMTFPGGKKKQITVSATAGNAVATKGPGYGKRWIVLSIRVTLVADGNAASRFIILKKDDGTNVVIVFATHSGAITAGQTSSQQWLKNPFNEVTDHASAPGECSPPIGIGFIMLEGDDRLNLSIANGLAGDSYSGHIVVLEVDV